MQNIKPPKVSVCIVTYNQEQYIRQCLQSVVDQEVDFEVEIIVSDDCSTDSTPQIIQEFAEKYPDLIKTFIHTQNFGDLGLSNYKFVHLQATGEYVAHLDGDDFMYPSKLLKQSKYLDSNQNHHLVAHRLNIIKNKKTIGITSKNPKAIDTQWLLLNHPSFLHSSVMYRREKIKNLYSNDLFFIDFYLYVYSSIIGEIGFINEVLGEYNADIGISSKFDLMPLIQDAINLAQGQVSTVVIGKAKAKQYLSYASRALINNNHEMFINFLENAKKNNPASTTIKIAYTLRKNKVVLKNALRFYKSVKNLRN
jgi:glycosyltransferase involved in cell wall biosynthesis